MAITHRKVDPRKRKPTVVSPKERINNWQKELQESKGTPTIEKGAGGSLSFTKGLPNKAEAEALQQLIIKEIKKKLITVPEGRQKFFELAKENGISERGIKSWLKKTDKAGGYREWQNIADDEKALRRALGEFLTTDPEWLYDKGILQAIGQNPSRLKGDFFASYLKSWDNYFSGEKGGKVLHHQTLSSARKLLERGSKQWVKRFNKLAEAEGFKMGDDGAISIDPIAHKPFDTVKKPGAPWNVKGVLKDRLQLPDSVIGPKGQLLIDKLDKDSGSYKLIKRLEELGAHNTDYGGTRGFEIPPDLADLPPEEAFKSARNILAAEKQIAAQGLEIDKRLRISSERAIRQNMTPDQFIDHTNRVLDKVTAKNRAKWGTDVPSVEMLTGNPRKGIPGEVELDRPEGMTSYRKLDPRTSGGAKWVNLESKYGSRLRTSTGKLRRGEGLARFGAAVGTGDVVGATVAGGQLAIGEVLKSSAAQKAIAKQVAEITAKRGAKTVAKMVPGLDILISGQETMQYLKEGKLDQAGIAALSGAIGWIPVVGDAGSAALDLSNTVLDISRLKVPTKKKKRPGTIGVPLERRGTRIRRF